MKVKSRIMLAVAAGMLVASTASVAAQEPEGEAAFFDATMTQSAEPIQPETVGSGQGWEGWVGMANTGVAVDAGDPRASGLLDEVRNGAEFVLPDGRMGVSRSALRLVNEQGTWVGEGTLTSRLPQQGPPTHLAALLRLEGEGAYEGLVLELHSPGLSEQMQEIWWGVIYPAEAIPEPPDPIGS